MKRTLIMIIMALAISGVAQEKATAKVTFYRSSGSFRGNTLFSCDHDRYKITVYQGSEKIIHIGRGKFVTMNLAPGSYTFKSGRSDAVSVTLKDGEQVFIRPHQTCGGRFLEHEALDIVPCAEAIEQAKPLDAIEAKDIYVDTKRVDDQRYFSGSCGKS